MKWKSITNILWKAMAYILMIFCILCLYFSFFRANNSTITIDIYNPVILLISSIFYILFLICIKKLLNQIKDRELGYISIGLMFLFFSGLLFVGLSTRIIPTVDLCHAYIESINMLNTEKITDIIHFGRYPHQKAVVYILYFLFQGANAIGFTDYRVLAIIFNAFMITLALFFLYKLICDYKGKTAAVLTEIIFISNPVIYFYVSYFYSDTLCLPFMIGGLWVAGKGLRETKQLRKYTLLIVAAIALVIGTEIRATVIFAIVAIFLVSVSDEPKKDIILVCLTLMLGLLIGKLMYQYIDSKYSGDISPDSKYPITHFLMMGSNKDSNGGWNYTDFNFTGSFETYKEKINETTAVTVERIYSMGFGGCFDLIKNKIARVWGDGRMGFQLYNVQMEEYNFIYEYSMGDQGVKSIFLQGIVQFMRCSLYFLMLVALVVFVFTEKWRLCDKFSIVVCLAAFMFYIFWESHPRYSLMFLPIMSLLAGSGVDALDSLGKLEEVSVTIYTEGIDTKNNVIPIQSFISRIKRGAYFVLIVLSLIFWVVNYHYYADNIQERSEMRVRQDANLETKIIDQEGLLQSFIPRKKFNCVQVHFRNDKIKGQSYYFQILNEEGIILVEEEFLSDNVSDNRYKIFRFDTINPSKNEIFYIKIFSAEDYDTSIKLSIAYRKQSEAYASGYDFYPDGDLIRRDIPEHTDMVFRVTNIKMRSIVSKRVYFLLSVSSILFELLIMLILSKESKRKIQRISRCV